MVIIQSHEICGYEVRLMFWKQEVKFDISAPDILKFFMADNQLESLIHAFFKHIDYKDCVSSFICLKCSAACYRVDSVAEWSNMIGPL